MVTGKSVPCGDDAIVDYMNPYVFCQRHGAFYDVLKIYNVFTGELIREKEIEDIQDLQVGLKFITVQSEYKVSAFDLEEMTNKRIENDQLWQRDFKINENRANYIGTTKSQMMIARGRVVKIYDFWPDRDLEVKEDIDSDESWDEDEMYEVDSETFNDSDWDTLSEESFEEDHE